MYDYDDYGDYGDYGDEYGDEIPKAKAKDKKKKHKSNSWLTSNRLYRYLASTLTSRHWCNVYAIQDVLHQRTDQEHTSCK